MRHVTRWDADGNKFEYEDHGSIGTKVVMNGRVSGWIVPHDAGFRFQVSGRSGLFGSTYATVVQVKNSIEGKE